ncbi:MAG: preprotein translocase subunit SecE [Candidatus Eremiobacteraeota bacterium]|nr:preprotein translocase subunit SecE [Candidatus Eremiobacteraeota bacterium]
MEKLKKLYFGVAKYLKSVQTELKRVSWPDKNELRTSTIVVFVTLFVVTSYLGVCDVLFSKIFEKIFTTFK